MADQEYIDLYHKALQADWNATHPARTTDGVTITFRKHYTSAAPGVESRQVHGNDTKDAMRKFLAELGEQISR